MRRKDRALATSEAADARREPTAVPIGRHWWGRAESAASTLGEAGRAQPEDRFDEMRRRERDDGIIEVLVGDAHDSVALERWRDRLGRYVEQQGPLDALRLRPSSEPPWPATDNPMLGYLVERSSEIATAEDADAGLTWLAKNAWFEGVIAERARIERLIDEE